MTKLKVGQWVKHAGYKHVELGFVQRRTFATAPALPAEETVSGGK